LNIVFAIRTKIENFFELCNQKNILGLAERKASLCAIAERLFLDRDLRLLIELLKSSDSSLENFTRPSLR